MEKTNHNIEIHANVKSLGELYALLPSDRAALDAALDEARKAISPSSNNGSHWFCFHLLTQYICIDLSALPLLASE